LPELKLLSYKKRSPRPLGFARDKKAAATTALGGSLAERGKSVRYIDGWGGVA